MNHGWMVCLMALTLTASTAAPARAAGPPVTTIDPPVVRLTPPVTAVAGLERFEVSLDGAWGFRRELPEGFDGRVPDPSAWARVTVPGHFSLQGLGEMHRELGVPVAYHRRLSVPSAWAGRRVVLRFGSVEGLARFYVNGVQVAELDTHYLPVELDITDRVTPGEDADLVVTLARSAITSWWRPVKGGIRRSVTMTALPAVNLSSLHAETEVDPETGGATLLARLAVANQSGAPVEGAVVELGLTGPDGEAVAIDPERAAVTLGSIPPGQSRAVRVAVPVPGAALWDPEHPVLYRLSGGLRVGGDLVMTAARPIGFRQIEVDGSTLRFNGRPLKLRGANYHMSAPGHDYAPPAETLRADVRRFRDANLNYLRPWPTGAPAFMEACDELGMLMQVELPISGMLYRQGPLEDRGDDPTYRDALLQWAHTMVEHYRSHPSVLIWSLGNECYYYDYFRDAAELIGRLDPSRPVIFSSDQRIGIGAPHLDINDDHYPLGGRLIPGRRGGIEGGAWEFPDDRPNMFSEWCHVPMGNWAERNLDPGIFDYWVHYADAHAEYTYRNDHMLGGALFTGAPVTALHETFLVGFWDFERRVNDLYWHTLKANSPVRIYDTRLRRAAGSDAAEVSVVNRSRFAGLGAYTIRYRQGSRRGEIAADVPAMASGTLRVPVDWADASPVELEFIGPRGFVVDRYRLTREGAVFPAPAGLEPGGDAGAMTLRATPGAIVVSDGRASWSFDRVTGMLQSGAVDGRPVLAGGPRLWVTRSAYYKNHEQDLLPAGENALSGWRAESVQAVRHADRIEVVVLGAFEQARGLYRFELRPGGRLAASYDFRWSAEGTLDVFDAGLSVGVWRGFDELSWARRAYWSMYPEDHVGRASGATRAGGAPRWAEARAAHREGQRRPWPWSQDLLGGVTRDFRSTKANIHWAALRAPGGPGVLVDGGGSQHVRVEPADDRYWLHARDFYNGGSEFHLVKSVRLDVMQLGAGDALRGSATLRLLPEHAGEPTARTR